MPSRTCARHGSISTAPYLCGARSDFVDEPGAYRVARRTRRRQDRRPLLARRPRRRRDRRPLLARRQQGRRDRRPLVARRQQRRQGRRPLVAWGQRRRQDREGPVGNGQQLAEEVLWGLLGSGERRLSLPVTPPRPETAAQITVGCRCSRRSTPTSAESSWRSGIAAPTTSETLVARGQLRRQASEGRRRMLPSFYPNASTISRPGQHGEPARARRTPPPASGDFPAEASLLA